MSKSFVCRAERTVAPTVSTLHHQRLSTSLSRDSARPYASHQSSRRLFVSQEDALVTAEENETVVESNGVGFQDTTETVIALDPPGINDDNQHRVSRYEARKECSHGITEGDRPLSEYMTLPVSQYSVLDAEKVERLDDSTFRVQTATVKFLKTEMTPVMILTVEPHSTGCEVQLLECILEGSQVAKDANERFACYMRNYISFIKDEETSELKLTANCVVQVAGIVPRWISAVLPIRAIDGLGGRMLGKILEVAMPRFLLQLEKDYQTWASGDDSRQALSTGESFGVLDGTISSDEE